MKLLALCNDRMALPALDRLMQSGVMAGVGMSARQSEVQSVVKMMCARYGVPFRLFNKTTFTADLQYWVEDHQPDAVIVKTFPWRIPEEVLALPEHGFINFHYAPLPAYRGPNPLFWMVKDGIKEAGVTVHHMTPGIDEGPVLLSSTFPVPTGFTFGMLCSQLGFTGLQLTDSLLKAIAAGPLRGQVQDNAGAGWYERPGPKDLGIDWEQQDAETVRRLVSACNPWNKGAPASLNGWTLGLTYVTPLLTEVPAGTMAGTILALDERHGLCIACAGNTAVRADIVYTEEGFLPGWTLKGWGITPGMKFTAITNK